MLIGIIHKGSGLGDQLFSYIATRVRAADLGVDFGFVGKEFFKGASFMNLDWGEETGLASGLEEHTGKVFAVDKTNLHSLPEIILNKPYYDPEFNFIPDGSVIDSYGAQDIRYFEHRLDEVREWLQIKSELTEGFGDQVCVINFRGGEYRTVSDLFLTKEYWDQGIQIMKDKGYDNEHFLVTTDDVETAKQYFPDFRVKHESIEDDWGSILVADDLIISNSAFAIIPALLNIKNASVIAPRYWAGRNVGEWRRPGNYYKKFIYI